MTAHCEQFFGWYNDEHHHSGIGMLTPLPTVTPATVNASIPPDRLSSTPPTRPTRNGSPTDGPPAPPAHTGVDQPNRTTHPLNHPTRNQENRQSTIDRLQKLIDTIAAHEGSDVTSWKSIPIGAPR